MNRIRPAAAGADKPLAVAAVAREIESLAICNPLLQAYPDQAAIMWDAELGAKFVRSHMMLRDQMTPEMLEQSPTFGARQALAIEPRIYFRNRMKLITIQVGILHIPMKVRPPRPIFGNGKPSPQTIRVAPPNWPDVNDLLAIRDKQVA